MNAYEQHADAMKFADDLQQGEELEAEEQMRGAKIIWKLVDRIAELEKELKEEQEHSEILQKDLDAYEKQSEPVAWAIKSDGDFTEIGWDNEVLHEVEEWYTAQGWQYEYLPLYTTPQTKPLTDDEIDKILESLDVYIDTHAGVKLFAKAIEERHGIK